MNNTIIHTFGIYGLVRLFIAIDTRPITIQNPKNPQIASITLNFENIFSLFHHYLNSSPRIPLDMVSIVPRNPPTCDTENHVKESFVTCGAVIPNCICLFVFSNPDHNPQVILFFGVIF